MAATTATMKLVTELTPEELAGLNKKPYIKIQWRQKTSDKLQLVFEEFPKAIAMAFSPLINDHFTRKVLSGRTFIVEGATLETSKAVFGWMLCCCKEGSMISLTTSSEKAFAVYLNIYIAAAYLQIAPFKNNIFEKLVTLANTDFQCAEDVNELYAYFPKGHPMRKMIVNGTVKCWFTGKFGKVGKTSDGYYNEITEAFEEDVKRQFKKGMKDFDPKWTGRAKLSGVR